MNRFIVVHIIIDGMPDVLEMQSDLMRSSCDGHTLHKRCVTLFRIIKWEEIRVCGLHGTKRTKKIQLFPPFRPP